MDDFPAWAAERQARIETVLDRVLPPASVVPTRLHEAMRYAVLGGGKRVRPLLAFAAGEVTDADATRVEIAAAAVELIHGYSLVHDDLPAMDNDSLRRGKPTVHVEFDEATALLVGDSLQSMAFQVLAENPITGDPQAQLGMIANLAHAAGSRGMAGGQAMDLAVVGHNLALEELELMHIHKTGALIRGAVMLGAHCGTRLKPPELDALDHYGKCMGLAFQVVDDVLDAEVSTATLGKTAGKDQATNKPTYATMLGTERAREFAAELHSDAMSALSTFGERARRLRDVAAFVVSREF